MFCLLVLKLTGIRSEDGEWLTSAFGLPVPSEGTQEAAGPPQPTRRTNGDQATIRVATFTSSIGRAQGATEAATRL
jgi:hypothetical protein